MSQIRGMSKDGKRITIKKFEGNLHLASTKPEGPADEVLLVIDTETTGLNPNTDQIIEFAAAKFSYDPIHGVFTSHYGTWDWLQEPDKPISPEVTKITGLTNDMVQGQTIPNAVLDLLANADLIISHNAVFDHAFCLKQWPEIESVQWGCSLHQINWQKYGIPSSKLEIIARYHGFFYDAHRAQIDVEALAQLLQMAPEKDALTYFQEILIDLRRRYFLVEAVRCTFYHKDSLKARGYRWDATKKVWCTILPKESLLSEFVWFDDTFGAGKQPIASPLVRNDRWEIG